jgi:hypothetical protein
MSTTLIDEQFDGPKSRIAPILIDNLLAATSVIAAVRRE